MIRLPRWNTLEWMQVATIALAILNIGIHVLQAVKFGGWFHPHGVGTLAWVCVILWTSIAIRWQRMFFREAEHSKRLFDSLRNRTSG